MHAWMLLLKMPVLLKAVLMPMHTPLNSGVCTWPGNGRKVVQLTRLTLSTVAEVHHALELTPDGQVMPAAT